MESNGFREQTPPQIPWSGLACLDAFRLAGKKLFIYSTPDRVQSLLNAISTDGVYLSMRCSDEEEAQQVLLELGRIGR